MKDIEGTTNELPTAAFEKYLAALRGRVGDAKYKSWFLDLGLAGLSKECVTLSTGSQAKMDMLDNRFLPLLADTWRREVGPVDSVRLTVKRKLLEHAARVEKTETPASKPAAFEVKTTRKSGVEKSAPADLASPLDARRTFESFAIGASNQIAWAAARQALNKVAPAELIYIYGSSGLGKTHLLQSIAHEWKRDEDRGSCAYVTYNNLINACVSAVWSNNTSALHKSLLEHSLLAFDDIHLLEGKNRTQEELLIVIDAALDNGKQVVIAGELPPAKLAEAGVNERLADRLTGGICAPINGGDDALRLEVLKKRAEQADLTCAFDPSVLEFVARTFTHSMRETIGAFNQLALMFGDQQRVISFDEAKGVLKSRLEDRRKASTISDAIAAGAEAFGLKVEDITGRAQPQRIVRARHAIVWCAREVLKESFPQIGKALRRDHTTVMSSYRRAQALLERDKAFQNAVRLIREALED